MSYQYVYVEHRSPMAGGPKTGYGSDRTGAYGAEFLANGPWLDENGFDPRGWHRGHLPPSYEGPQVVRPKDSNEPVVVLGFGGERMVDFPPGTVVERIGHTGLSLEGGYPQDACLRNDYFIRGGVKEGVVLRVELPPKPTRPGDRVLIPSNPETLIFSVDRTKPPSEELGVIPFPEFSIWADRQIDQLTPPPSDDTNYRYTMNFDLFRSGNLVYVMRSIPFVNEEGSVAYKTQLAYWDPEKEAWVLLRGSDIKYTEQNGPTVLSNGGLITHRYDRDLGIKRIAVYRPNPVEPGFELLEEWHVKQPENYDFKLTPDGSSIIYTGNDPDPSSTGVFLVRGSVPYQAMSKDEQPNPPEVPQRLADLPPFYNLFPRLVMSPDGTTIAVVSGYSGETPIYEGKQTIPDFHTIHNKPLEEPITAAMVTVLKKGADGHWHSHYVALPEGWGMPSRYTLSWDSDGNLIISQFDNTKPEDEAWSHHVVITSVLETGILPYETFFVSNPESITFRTGMLTITDTNGVRRQIVIGFQPDDDCLDRLRSDIKLAKEKGMTLWVTYDGQSQTVRFGLEELSMGFVGDQIGAQPYTLVDVTYHGPVSKHQLPPNTLAELRRRDHQQLFGYFRRGLQPQ